MRRARRIIPLLALVLLLVGARVCTRQDGMLGGDALWFNPPGQGAPRVTLHFFWSSRCPHCLEAKPFVESLPARYPWLDVASYELNDDPENRSRFIDMAALLGRQPASVPTFMLCARIYVGWGGDQHGAALLEQKLLECYASVYGANASGSAQAPGVLLVAARQRLNRLGTAAVLFAAAFGGALLIAALTHRHPHS